MPSHAFGPHLLEGGGLQTIASWAKLVRNLFADLPMTPGQLLKPRVRELMRACSCAMVFGTKRWVSYIYRGLCPPQRGPPQVQQGDRVWRVGSVSMVG